MQGYYTASSITLPTFTGVYVFGDSLVDPGNALRAVNFLDALPFTSAPDRAPTADKGYFQGRFTDGYNFADLISNKLLAQPTKATFPYGFEDPLLGVPITVGGRPSGTNLSFAYGGAQIIQGDEIVPDLDAQTDAYKDWPQADPNALYIVTIGGNDLRELVPRNSAPVTGDAASAKFAAIATELAQEVGQLFAFGVRHLLVTGMPDISLIPYYAGALDEALKRSLAAQYADQLQALVDAELAKLSLPAGASLATYSLQAFSDALLANPAAYNITDTTQARTVAQAGALEAVGGGYLFFDDVHPSAQVHAQVAADILEALGGGIEGPVAAQEGPRTFAGIEAQSGADEFQASLVAGRTYIFDALGISSGSGGIPDPRLQILGATGVALGEDDDGGLGLDAHLAFTAPATGLYTLRVSGVGVAQGSYVVQGPDLRGSNVRVEGGSLNDTIGALSGVNILRGGDGADLISGGVATDDIAGGAGADTGAGGTGDDKLMGEAGNDLLNGNAGADVVDGGDAADEVRGGQGADVVRGGADNDGLWGDLGDDQLNGNVGADTVEGGDGNDTLRGGQGHDLLRGGAGGDLLSGDLGDDALSGGAGADIFQPGSGDDRVLDWSLADGDRVQLPSGTSYTLAQVGADAVITLAGGGRLTLVGVAASSLSGGWILA